jgi:hypothetical protein
MRFAFPPYAPRITVLIRIFAAFFTHFLALFKRFFPGAAPDRQGCGASRVASWAEARRRKADCLRSEVVEYPQEIGCGWFNRLLKNYCNQAVFPL